MVNLSELKNVPSQENIDKVLEKSGRILEKSRGFGYTSIGKVT